MKEFCAKLREVLALSAPPRLLLHAKETDAPLVLLDNRKASGNSGIPNVYIILRVYMRMCIAPPATPCKRDRRAACTTRQPKGERKLWNT